MKKILVTLGLLGGLLLPARYLPSSAALASSTHQSAPGICNANAFEGRTNCVLVPHGNDFLLAVFDTNIVLTGTGNSDTAGTEVDVVAVTSPCPGAQTQAFQISANGPMPSLFLETPGTLYRYNGTDCVPVNAVFAPGVYEVYPPQDYTLSAVIDGHLDVGWESAPGQTTNQTIVVSLGNGRLWQLTDVLIDPEATAGDTPSSDLRNFQVLVSSTGTNPSDFHSVLQGTCKQQTGLQHFPISGQVVARYVKLVGIDNYGGNRMAVSELEVYGRPASGSARLRANISRPAAKSKPKGSTKKQKSLAQVKYIHKGLTVRPPSKKSQKGKTNMSLYQLYLLQTKKQQRASFRFKDGTTVHMDQLTDALLRDPHVTVVNKGQINELAQPGTDHKVKTALAVATSVGTNFLVRVQGKKETIIVIEGAVSVSNPEGTQVVKTQQQTVIQQNKAPSIPKPVDASKQIAWTNAIPAPPLSVNVALDTNGGEIVSGPGNP